MARALRIEYPGARYHLMCRGNQSRNIFNIEEDSELFIRCLGEMCKRNETVVHAWCLMSNHYHLLLETPRGNLTDAMKWFQGTFTQRYNARNKLWRHLFQGRYKSKLIDDSDPSYFRRVSEYIHLNPAEARLVGYGELDRYPWSSYPRYLAATSKRPEWLVVLNVLNACGIPNDSQKSRRAYQAYMNLRHQVVLSRKWKAEDRKEWAHMERGWIHGGAEFRERMIACFEDQGTGHSKGLVDLEQKRDMNENAAEAVLQECLKHFGVQPETLPQLAKSDPMKMLIAGLLRYHYPVSVEWVSIQLHMGHFTTVSRAMRFYDGAEGKWKREKCYILKFIG